VPALDGPTAVVLAHRMGAVGTVVLLGWLVRLARADGVGQPAAWASLGLSVVQALSGALVVWTRLGLFSTLAHAAIMAVLFASLAAVLRVAVGVKPASRQPGRPLTVGPDGMQHRPSAAQSARRSAPRIPAP